MFDLMYNVCVFGGGVSKDKELLASEAAILRTPLYFTNMTSDNGQAVVLLRYLSILDILPNCSIGVKIWKKSENNREVKFEKYSEISDFCHHENVDQLAKIQILRSNILFF